MMKMWIHVVSLVTVIAACSSSNSMEDKQEGALSSQVKDYSLRIKSGLDTFLKVSTAAANTMALGSEKCAIPGGSSIVIRVPVPSLNRHYKVVLLNPLPNCQLQGGFVFEDHVVPDSSGIVTSQAGGIAAQHVAIIGDSQSAGLYGTRLAERIRGGTTAKLNFFGGACSAQIYHWVVGGFRAIPSSCFQTCESSDGGSSCLPVMNGSQQTARIATILANHPKVDLFIITLGDNHFGANSTISSDVPLLVTPIIKAGRRCVWVTPTRGLGRYADKESLIQTLLSSLAKVKQNLGQSCAIVDSYHMGKDVLKSQSDLQIMNQAVARDPMLLHPQGDGAILWANRVVDKLLQDGLVQKIP